MAEQIISKRCPKCKEIKPISEFHKDKSKLSGCCSYCKMCNSKTSNEYYIKHREIILEKTRNNPQCKIRQKFYRQTEKGKAKHCQNAQLFQIRHPERDKAGKAVKKAIRENRLPKLKSLQCHYCPATAKHYHHYIDYEPDRWLDVIPVCVSCHTKLHQSRIIA